jgi:hypothetical protein
LSAANDRFAIVASVRASTSKFATGKVCSDVGAERRRSCRDYRGYQTAPRRKAGAPMVVQKSARRLFGDMRALRLLFARGKPSASEKRVSDQAADCPATSAAEHAWID